MIIKTLGAILIIAACGCFGFLTAATHRRSAKLMRQLLSAIDNITQELRYRMCSLPDAFRNTAQYCNGTIGVFFDRLTNELEKQVAPDILCCVDAALSQMKDIPDIVKMGLL